MNNKKQAIIVVICTIGIVVISAVIAAVIMKYHLLDDLTCSEPVYSGNIYSALGMFTSCVAVILIVMTAENAYDNYTNRKKGRTRSKDTSYGYGVTYKDMHSDDNEDNSKEFRYPVGKVPVWWDPENRFTDLYGHEYVKRYGSWYDDNDNMAPGYLYDYYGLSEYESRYDDTD